ncbi:hypothetical protein Fmac_026692 [Flemingia macrophylla]|uniref:Uncharacterized protein n=1 Tax=Flemingia macrophylla TaxID=520843 RepID=A0ABD1LFU8_9FABA
MGFWVSLIFVVRIQLGQGSAAQVTTTMLKNEGVATFYKVILLFSLIMDPLCDDCGVLLLLVLVWPNVSNPKVLTPFRILTSKAIEANDGKPLPLYQKALCGLTAGAIGAYCFDFLAWNCLFSNDVVCLKLIMYYEKGTSGRTRLVAVATQKFVAEVAGDALQDVHFIYAYVNCRHCKARQATIPKDKRDKQQKDKRLVLTMEDLSKALREDVLISDLVRYCISLGLLQGIDTVREARDRVHKLVARLKELSLLSESFSSRSFTMQSLARDEALLIASKRCLYLH